MLFLPLLSALLPAAARAADAQPSATQRADWVGAVRDLAKSGKIAAQWYPGYAADLLAPAAIDYSSVNLMFWFVQTTTAQGLDTSVDGPLLELVAGAAMNNVPVVATVGGWDGGRFFSDLVATDSGRQQLASQFATFADTHALAGMEIDWEYPGSQGIGCNKVSPQDLDNLGAFIKELRSQLGPDRLISIAVSSAGLVDASKKPATDLAAFADPLDFINIMNYDTYGSWTATTGPNAALDASCSTDAAVGAISSSQLFSSVGVPKTKLLMGVPGYGYMYQTKASTLASKAFPVTFANGTQGQVESRLYQQKEAKMPQGDETDSEGKDVCGNFEGFSGIFLYSSLVRMGFLSADGTQGANGFERIWDDCTSTPFLFNSKNNSLISYDDASSLAIKASWAQDTGMAGTTIFDSTGPSAAVVKAIKAASSGDRASLWAQGIMTFENVTVASDGQAAGSGAAAGAGAGTAGGATGGGSSAEPSASSASSAPSSSSSSSAAAKPTSSEVPVPSSSSSAPSAPSSSASSGSSGSSGSGGSSGSSSGKSSYVKCLSETHWALCDASGGCTKMGKVSAGTVCKDGSMQMASAKKRRSEGAWSRARLVGRRA